MMDRVVIEASHTLHAKDFVAQSGGPFALEIRPQARVKFLQMLHQLWSVTVTGCGQSEPSSYLQQSRTSARRYRQAVLDLDRNTPLHCFCHPSPISHNFTTND